MIDRVNVLIKKLDEIQNILHFQIKPLQDEINQLKKNYKEIHELLISTKLIKIIIKYFILNGVKFFTMEGTSCLPNNLQVKCSGLDSMKVMHAINSLTRKNRKIISTIHMDGAIDKIIEILYSLGNRITLGDLIEQINIDNETKENIRKNVEITKINQINIYYDIIGNVPI